MTQNGEGRTGDVGKPVNLGKPVDGDGPSLTDRYPELSDIASKAPDDQLESYRAVLASLQRRLDDTRA
ncbi:hypothetical protein [Bifidobacterium myosotis]|uniref:Uncharacterized protein n=1 Tax=Bifidobacterium myosotis TaxID=1630166 RepID=A0A5M9ZNE8_9BIFI|nr:hypothetical protein [Bifidobacterium myosotis]KAA8829144.1 hypothetical protein EMO91_03990 [Bifidobacterium myosotis]